MKSVSRKFAETIALTAVVIAVILIFLRLLSS